MNIFELTPKYASDTRNCVADFIGELGGSVTISSAAVTGPVYSGADSTLTIGAPSISGSTVTASIAGGAAGTVHQLIFAATLSDSQVIRYHAFLAILPDSL
jgi:hypothetical protein